MSNSTRKIKNNNGKVHTTIRKTGARVASVVIPATLTLGLAFSFVFGPKIAKSCNSEAVKPPKGSENIETVPEQIVTTYYEETVSPEPSYTEETVETIDFGDEPSTTPSIPNPIPDIIGGISTDVEETIQTEPTLDPIESTPYYEPETDTTYKPEIDTVYEPETEPIQDVGANLADIFNILTENIRETNSNQTILISAIQNFQISQANNEYNIDLTLGGTLGAKYTKYVYFNTPITTDSKYAEVLFNRSTDQNMTTGEYINLLYNTLNDNHATTTYEVSKLRDKIEVDDETQVIKYLLGIRSEQVTDPRELATLNKLTIHPEKASLHVFNAIRASNGLDYTSDVVINFGGFSYQFKISTSFTTNATADEVKEVIRAIISGEQTTNCSIDTYYVDNSIYSQMLSKLNQENSYGLN